LLDGLADRIFGVAPGRWTLKRCSVCGAAGLDPRPTPATIGRAYERYYTHEGGPERHFLVPGDRPDLAFKRALHASHYQRAYGHRLAPALPGGWMLLACSARRRARADHYIRHLEAPRTDTARLLDVGCGNGAFLRVARALGYQAEGVEIDAVAAARARQAGFTVHAGSLADMPERPGHYEQITLNHVIEHLHDPLAALQGLQRALKPGGRVWLQTPNLAGRGAERYRDNWRGYEPPRHVVLFDAPSLRRALSSAGFERMALLPPLADALFFICQSEALAARVDPYAAGRPTRAQRRLARAWDRASLLDWGSAEAITMIGFKP
jgi:SAM-dependent methyltransferase